MKKLIIITSMALTSPLLAQAADNATLASSEAKAPTFKTIDANHDGKITRQEASAFSALEVTFDKVDTNKNGTLDAGEFSHSQPTSGESK